MPLVPESELTVAPQALYDISVTPTEEQTNSFAWIRNHPGVFSFRVENPEGGPGYYTYEPIITPSPSYIVEDTNIEGLPEHIFLARNTRTGNIAIAKAGVKRLPGSMYKSMDLLNETLKTGVNPHPNIVEVFDLVSDKDGVLHIIMEYLPNGNLQQWLTQIHTVLEISQMVEQISSALTHIHETKKMLYLHMKPRNVGLDAHNVPKIIDFEISEWMRDQESVSGGTRSPDYAAPEQDKLEVVTIQTDVYSLAATVYSIFTEIPNSGFDTKDLRYAFEKNPNLLLPFRKEYGSLFSEKQKMEISEVIQRGLSFNPKDRPKSVSEFDQEFQQALR